MSENRHCEARRKLFETGRRFRAAHPIPSPATLQLVDGMTGLALVVAGWVVQPYSAASPAGSNGLWLGLGLAAAVDCERAGRITALLANSGYLVWEWMSPGAPLQHGVEWLVFHIASWLLIIWLADQRRNLRRWLLRAWSALYRQSLDHHGAGPRAHYIPVLQPWAWRPRRPPHNAGLAGRS